jgi:hypothetical protein
VDRLRLLSKPRICCPIKPLTNFHKSPSESYIIIFINKQKIYELRLWGLSEIHGPLLGYLGTGPMYRLNPLLIGPEWLKNKKAKLYI